MTVSELIAVIIGTGSSKSGVLEVADRIFHSLIDGASALADLQAISGVGQSKALRIIAALRLHSALQQQIDSAASLDKPEAIYQAMEDTWEMPQEHLAVFYLTVHQTKVKREFVSIGTLSASLLHPREVYRPAILNNAAHIVLAHNHPSGCLAPSQADLQATRVIAEAGYVLGIELLDHVICAKSGFTSLRKVYPELFT